MQRYTPVFSDGVVSLLTASRQAGDWNTYPAIIEFLEEDDVGLIASDDGHILVFREVDLG